MKNLSKIISAFMALIFVLSVPFSAFADEEYALPADTAESADQVFEAPVILSGWNNIDGIIFYYYEQLGSYATGLATIDKKKYYFDEYGVMVKGWKTISGKRYYFAKSGALGIIGAAATGRKKIDKKWYYFDKNGVQQKKSVKVGNTTYYINSSGNLEAYKKKTTYYKPDGKKMTDYEKSDYTTLRTARKILAEITDNKMSKAEKLEACFQWVSKKPYVHRRKFNASKGWPAVYANDNFKRSGGDCHSDASAFAYFARALGYKNVYVCIDNKGNVEGHSWAEINGKVYDPQFITTHKGGKKRFYGGTYKKYGLTAIRRFNVAKGY